MNDELANGLANLAAMLGTYYLHLLEHGFPPHMAVELVRDFQRIQLERVLNINGAQPQPVETPNG